jgi:transcriptional regulator of arginine metabolism
MEVKTQEDLVEELKKEGFLVTQATISRDLSSLGLVKAKLNNGVSVYLLPEVEKLRNTLASFVKKIDRAENLVVIKTEPGAAQSVAASIDRIDMPEILGTVAGDDTILVVGRDRKNAVKVKAKLLALKSKALVKEE